VVKLKQTQYPHASIAYLPLQPVANPLFLFFRRFIQQLIAYVLKATGRSKSSI